MNHSDEQANAPYEREPVEIDWERYQVVSLNLGRIVEPPIVYVCRDCSEVDSLLWMELDEIDAHEREHQDRGAEAIREETRE